MGWIVVLVPIMGMFVGIVAILAEHRQKMAMIERGLNPEDLKSPPSPQGLLRGGLIVVGIGAGFFLTQVVGQIIPWLFLPAFLFVGVGGGTGDFVLFDPFNGLSCGVKRRNSKGRIVGKL